MRDESVKIGHRGLSYAREQMPAPPIRRPEARRPLLPLNDASPLKVHQSGTHTSSPCARRTFHGRTQSRHHQHRRGATQLQPLRARRPIRGGDASSADPGRPLRRLRMPVRVSVGRNTFLRRRPGNSPGGAEQVWRPRKRGCLSQSTSLCDQPAYIILLSLSITSPC